MYAYSAICLQVGFLRAFCVNINHYRFSGITARALEHTNYCLLMFSAEVLT